jgi:thiol-disulfide isomerase/thioredoxin
LRGRFVKHLKSIALQIVIFAVFVSSMHYFQTRHMASGRAVEFRLSGITEDAMSVPARSPGKISLIYFFAPWCRICKLSMSNLNKIQSDLPYVNIQVVALDYESKDDVLAFVRELGIAAPVFYGTEKVRDAWRISAYPSYYVLDEDSVIRAKAVGYSSKYGMMAKIFWSKWFS